MFEGQPKGLYALALANTGERFGYYTMLAIFTLFLQAKFGFTATVTSNIFAGFLALVYFLPVIGGILADKQAAEAANPIHYISKTSAPMLLMHGTADTVVSPSQTDLLYQALQKSGIPSERYLVTGAAHGGKYWVQEPVLKIITDFFDHYLK